MQNISLLCPPKCRQCRRTAAFCALLPSNTTHRESKEHQTCQSIFCFLIPAISRNCILETAFFFMQHEPKQYPPAFFLPFRPRFSVFPECVDQSNFSVMTFSCSHDSASEDMLSRCKACPNRRAGDHWKIPLCCIPFPHPAKKRASSYCLERRIFYSFSSSIWNIFSESELLWSSAWIASVAWRWKFRFQICRTGNIHRLWRISHMYSGLWTCAPSCAPGSPSESRSSRPHPHHQERHIYIYAGIQKKARKPLFFKIGELPIPRYGTKWKKSRPPLRVFSSLPKPCVLLR